MRILSRSFLIALPLIAACTWGTRVKSLAVATTPTGVHAYYRIVGDTLHRYGELFTVDHSELLIHGARVVRVPWARLEYLNVDTLGNRYDVKAGQRPDSAKVERLRLVSRFPQGLAEPMLTQVLAALKQERVEELP